MVSRQEALRKENTFGRCQGILAPKSDPRETEKKNFQLLQLAWGFQSRTLRTQIEIIIDKKISVGRTGSAPRKCL